MQDLVNLVFERFLHIIPGKSCMTLTDLASHISSRALTYKIANILSVFLIKPITHAAV